MDTQKPENTSEDNMQENILDDHSIENNYIIERDREYSDVSSVESQKDNLIPEEFPEGSYGSPINSKILGKKEPFIETQRATSAFNYEGKHFHEGIKRQYPNSHPTHDDSKPEEQHPDD